MSDQFFWFVTRSAALITWFSAAASILIGLMTSSRVLGRRPTIPWLIDLHRVFAGMSMTFLGVHMASLWFDGFTSLRFDDLLIPWVAEIPGLTNTSIALGVLAAWLMAAVQVSSLLKDHLNDRLWHTIHLLSFGTLGLGTLHAIQAGSDVFNPIVLGVGVATLTAIGLAVCVRVVRLLQSRVEDPQPVSLQQPPESELQPELLLQTAVRSHAEPPVHPEQQPLAQWAPPSSQPSAAAGQRSILDGMPNQRAMPETRPTRLSTQQDQGQT